MNILKLFHPAPKLAAEVATLNADNAERLDLIVKISRERNEAIEEFSAAVGARIKMQAERDALQYKLNACNRERLEAQAQLAKIAALGTVGMSATVAKAVVLAGGEDIRVKVDRAQVLAVAARMKMQTAAVMEAF